MSESAGLELDGHVGQMYCVAMRIIGNDQDAHDVVQNACVKALRNIDRFDGRSALATWLHRITINCARDHLRTKKRRHYNNISMNEEMAGMLVALDASPVVQAERREMADIAALAVESLPTDCRSAFVLTQLDGYSYDEAAEIENQPRGTIASRVFRAKKILMDQLNAHPEERA